MDALLEFPSNLSHYRFNVEQQNGEVVRKVTIHVNLVKTFVTVVTFLAIFAFLISIMPAQFLVSGSNYRQINVPTYFESIDLQTFASYYLINITSDSYQKFWGKSEFGHDMNFRAEKLATYNMLWNEHGYTLWGFWTGGHKQKWINENGTERGDLLTTSEIDLDSDNGTAKYTVECSHFQMKAWVGYDPTLYNSSKNAWDAHNMSVLFAIDFDERGSTLNAWNLLALLLFFQLPNVNPIINMLIAIPVWVCFAVLTFIVIIEIIQTLKPL